jgi:hypothetical protein
MFRWSVLPALLLVSLFLFPATLVSDRPGRDGLELTSQVQGHQLALVAFAPFCVVVKVGDSNFGVTTSYLVRRVELSGSTRFASPSPSSLILNPRGRTDVRIPLSFGKGPVRARWVPLDVAGIETSIDSS